MSRALDFLLKARPEPMRAYFSFLKQAGSHLDPKTAALISVITKVYAKTPTGLRQYLPRALKAGATADEVIDALLMAMPALGFSKIVWAIDVILEMNLPEFAHYQTEDLTADKWSVLGDVSDFAEGVSIYRRIHNRAVIVHKAGGEFRVYDAHCPHKGNLIPESGLVGDELVCPFHEWKFSLQNGACIAGGKTPLRHLPCRVDDGKLKLQI
jgi:nitrite reductase/ring-hydroxylating ferredoxin subunit/alkylhydroperoxidase/carboxymuconolactone decarboxylase family protein YurZ